MGPRTNEVYFLSSLLLGAGSPAPRHSRANPTSRPGGKELNSSYPLSQAGSFLLELEVTIQIVLSASVLTFRFCRLDHHSHDRSLHVARLQQLRDSCAQTSSFGDWAAEALLHNSGVFVPAYRSGKLKMLYYYILLYIIMYYYILLAGPWTQVILTQTQLAAGRLSVHRRRLCLYEKAVAQ